MDYHYLEKSSMCYRCKNKEICRTVYQANDCGIQQANWNCSHFNESKLQGDLISRKALLKRVDEEREYLLARGQTGAEHILVHNFRNLIEDASAEDVEEIISKFRNTAYRNGYITGLNKRPQNDWGKWIISEICCPNCFNYLDMDYYSKEELNKCPICGEDMWKGGTKE